MYLVWRCRISTVKDAVDCLLYEFDLEYFMDSELYKGVHSNYIDVLFNKKRDIEQEYAEIYNILDGIEFAIGTPDLDTHNAVIAWLVINNYVIMRITYEGVHWSDIHIMGNYNKCYREFKSRVSIESWDE